MPDNTLPMMTGFGQFGPLEMGGMFTLVKIREGLAAGDYTDPKPYKHPAGTVAYEVESPAPTPARAGNRNPSSTSAPKAVRPTGKSNHSGH